VRTRRIPQRIGQVNRDRYRIFTRRTAADDARGGPVVNIIIASQNIVIAFISITSQNSLRQAASPADHGRLRTALGVVDRQHRTVRRCRRVSV